MSCHDIGRGMNEVVRMTVSEFDRGEISAGAARRIIATCGVAVHWCDGNEGEALAYIRRCRCGKCLKLIPKGEKLLSLWELPYNYHDVVTKARLAADGICEKCFDEIMPGFCMGDDDAESLKAEIKNRYEDYPENYLSDGEHPDDNNGFRWVRGTDWYD